MVFSFLFSWWGRRPCLDQVQVVLYTRASCHLCETAWQILREEQSRFPFRLTSVDVDTDPELVARYGDKVPVVMVNGKERFYGRVNRVLLTRLLRKGF